MNYIRGAVNAISAPYQYYKDLPPINPSTLTGAIDVIVVQRPCPDGGSELACSPFHVRFGKWQVLRPAEKKVNVSVNGHPIPFNMKIGEAGEAFFVFETNEDVPDDLITSPILQPTRPEEHQEPDRTPASETVQHDVQTAAANEEMPEPEFLDLNALPYVSHPPPPSPSNNLAIDRQPPSPPLPVISSHNSSTTSLSHTKSLPSSRDEKHQPPNTRATSEPPPDISEEHLLERPPPVPLALSLPMQEYSWDWGAFPQPSPMNTGFGKNRRFDGGPIAGTDMHASWSGLIEETGSALPGSSESSSDEKVPENGIDTKPFRSQSVPPELEGSPATSRHGLPNVEAYNDGYQRHGIDQDRFGAGGRLSASRTDPTLFSVTIEGRKVYFELSLIPNTTEEAIPTNTVQHLLEPNQAGIQHLMRRSEFENDLLFDQGKVSYFRFIEDESIVIDKRLVIRWSGNQYITQSDGSPLVNSLILWRDTAIKERFLDIPSRPASPSSDEELVNGKELADDALSSDERDFTRSFSEPLEHRNQTFRKPTSSSWVRWWRRGQAKEADNAGSRSALDSTASQSSDRSKHVGVDTAMQDSHGPRSVIQRTQNFPTSIPTASQSSSVLPLPAPAGPEILSSKRYAKTLRLTSDQLKALNLKPGANTITFSLSTTGVIACTARIFVWDSTDVIVISDIDGTITKSDGLGHVFAMIGRDWTHVGVAKLYTDISRNGYKLMYLTSRAIGQADATRGYLKGIKQNDYQLPEGPVIMSPDRLIASLHREVIMRKPELFKMACLRDIRKLFGEASRNPFYAGFGNRITDALSYRSVDVPSARIFTIDTNGEVKMELLELAGYKSSYIHMTDLVDQMFPPIHRKWANDFTDFNYWKAPIQDIPLPDLTPPSPALSARSDTSNRSTLSRLRNFSLVPSRYASSRQAVPSQPATASDAIDVDQRTPQLKQMSSFERLSAALVGLAQSSSASPSGSRRSTSRESRGSLSSLTYADTASDDEYGDEWDEVTKNRRRERTRSVTSMPGSLDDIHFTVESSDVEDGDVLEGQGDDEHGHGEEATEEAFDEDFLATTQMKNVPYL